MDIQSVIQGLKNGSLDWKNFNPNNSALGYDADTLNFLNYMGERGLSSLGYNADSLNYNGGGAMGNYPSDPKALAAFLNSSVQSGAMTTYKMRVFYTPGPLPPLPVNVTFFATAFNDGVFNGNGDLVFTNANGDTATIQGLTTNGQGRTVSIQTLFNLTETEPFTVGFIRMRPKTQGQLDYAMDIISASQFGAQKSNSIAPDDYVDPNQFQILRVDVPMNSNASKKQGWSWTIDEDQTGSGISMTLFIPSTIDPTKELNGQPTLRNLNEGIKPPFYTPTVATGQIKSIAGNDAVKSIINSGVSKEMGQSLIKNIVSGMDLTNMGMARQLGK